MHMADALLSPVVGLTMCAVSASVCVYATKKIKAENELEEQQIPLMGVGGALVFAAQMINFTIPLTGSSGHIGGGILLAALLGPYPSFLTIAAVLVIQALFFADGGLLALGCNIFNMGVIPCLLIYPLLFAPIIKKGVNKHNLTTASILSVVVSLQLGAFSVVMETLLSGVTALPFGTFVTLMQPIHFAIGIVEGLVTAAILVFVYQMRPEILDSKLKGINCGLSLKKVVAILAVITVMAGGALSLYASQNPDGLEWSIMGVTGSEQLTANDTVHKVSARIQQITAFLPDYNFKSENGGTSLSGIIGAAITCALAGGTALIIKHKRQRKNQP